jgi:hypothetical protein
MYSEDTGRTVYSGSFPSTNNFLIELISSDYNQTETWGPERASTIHATPGAYHVRGNFIEPGTYLISVALMSVDGQPLTNPSADQYRFEITE